MPRTSPEKFVIKNSEYVINELNGEIIDKLTRGMDFRSNKENGEYYQKRLKELIVKLQEMINIIEDYKLK